MFYEKYCLFINDEKQNIGMITYFGDENNILKVYTMPKHNSLEGKLIVWEKDVISLFLRNKTIKIENIGHKEFMNIFKENLQNQEDKIESSKGIDKVIESRKFYNLKRFDEVLKNAHSPQVENLLNIRFLFNYFLIKTPENKYLKAVVKPDAITENFAKSIFEEYIAIESQNCILIGVPDEASHFVEEDIDYEIGFSLPKHIKTLSIISFLPVVQTCFDLFSACLPSLLCF